MRQFAPLDEEAARRGANLVVLPRRRSTAARVLRDSAEAVPVLRRSYCGKLAKQQT